MLKKCDKDFKEKNDQLKKRHNRKLRIRTKKYTEKTNNENDDL